MILRRPQRQLSMVLMILVLAAANFGMDQIAEARKLMHAAAAAPKQDSKVSMQVKNVPYSSSSSSPGSSSSENPHNSNQNGHKKKWDPPGEQGDPAGYGAYSPPAQGTLPQLPPDAASDATTSSTFYASEHLVPSGPDPLHN